MSAPVPAGPVAAVPAAGKPSSVPVAVAAGPVAASSVPIDAPASADPGVGEYQFGFSYPDKSVFRTRKGLDEEVVRAISELKEEPDWMLANRLRALAAFGKKPMPAWGADLSDIDFDEIVYYARPQDRPKGSWDELPEEIRETYRRIGVPEAERKFLAGVGAQYDSEIVYHSIRADLEKKGVIFCSPEVAVKEHPDLVRKYFGTVIPHNDNKFAALNTAVWSGGSFVYVPKGVKVDIPLQAYFRINSESFGQFERTLIIADEGSFVHYIEGCTAPVYATDSLHSAVVEIIALPGSRVRYSTIQNWSSDVYNLVTKRAVAYAGATMEWVDGNIGSKRTMKYPAVFLMGEGAHGEVLSIAFAGKGQEQDTGAKIIHAASNTSSTVTSKSISKDGGVASYRGMVKVGEGLRGIRSRVVCDALIVDPRSTSNTWPTMEVLSDDVAMEHEARVSKIGDEQLFYLQSRGLGEAEASAMIVNGFLDPLVKQLPMEYAVELNRLIELEMEGSVG
ncbi:MAG: Fe-S cluster assembly protein SufB [Spirochaetia bacterium]|nr:Fe-S cluster assembly protein SufB [Spirochaetia bacterium]